MAVPTDAKLVQAHDDLWHHSLCYLTPMALRYAIQLSAPTMIHRLGGSVSLPDLVTGLSLPAAKMPFLGHLRRLLATSGVLTASSGEAAGIIYRLTPLSYLLVDGVVIDGEASQATLVLTVISRYHQEAALWLADCFREDTALPIPSTFEDVHVMVLFEESMALLDPETDKLFNEALASHDHMGISTVLHGCGSLFAGLHSLTDCCSGDGTTARAIVKAFPHIKCTMLDLPNVIDRAPSTTLGVVVNYVDRR